MVAVLRYSNDSHGDCCCNKADKLKGVHRDQAYGKRSCL